MVWSSPRRCFVKLNVDGAWDWNCNAGGIRICSRSEDGAVCFVEARWIEGVWSSQEAEEWTLYSAMTLADEKGLHRSIFETDCAPIFKAVLHGVGQELKLSSMIQECRELMEKNVQWEVNLILREANDCADWLAKEAKERQWSWITHDAIPRWLSMLL
ncbi:hypothetical protein QQ045_019724 [Rhodiola kirilowii]